MSTYLDVNLVLWNFVHVWCTSLLRRLACSSFTACLHQWRRLADVSWQVRYELQFADVGEANAFASTAETYLTQLETAFIAEALDRGFNITSANLATVTVTDNSAIASGAPTGQSLWGVVTALAVAMCIRAVCA